MEADSKYGTQYFLGIKRTFPIPRIVLENHKADHVLPPLSPSPCSLSSPQILKYYDSLLMELISHGFLMLNHREVFQNVLK